MVKARAASLETGDGTLPSIELKAQASVRYPIHSLSFANQHIVTGNDRGTNMLYALDPHALVTSQDENPVDVGKSLKMVATFRNKLSRTPETPVPGRYIASRRVLCTDFEPISSHSSSTDANTTASSTRFLSAVGPIVHIWDINDTKAPVRDDRISHFQQTAGSWNPYPFSQLIALGGVDKQLTVIDIRKRGKPTVWKAKDAHRAPITDVKWSPFIPYWLGSAGDDHNVHIWDLRYANGPAFSLQRHQHRVTSLCWSNTYCDMLATGCADRHWRLWALRTDNSYAPATTDSSTTVPSLGRSSGGIPSSNVLAHLVADHAQNIHGSVNSICCPATFDNLFFACSTQGELMSFQLTEVALEAVAIHRFAAATHPNEYEIEQLVYQRDFADAAATFQLLSKQTSHDSTAISDLQSLAKLLAPKDSIMWDSWTLPPLPAQPNLSSHASPGVLSSRPRLFEYADVAEAMRQFFTDLRQFSYGLPPNALPRHHPTQQRVQLQEAMSRLSTGSEAQSIEAMVKDSDWKGLIKRRPHIEKGLQLAPHTYPLPLCKAILKAILPHDCPEALDLGLQVVRLTRNPSDSQLHDLASIVHLLLYPTVYDTESSSSASANRATLGSGGNRDSNGTVSSTTSSRHSGRSGHLDNSTGGTGAKSNTDLTMVRQCIYTLLKTDPRAALGMIELELGVQRTVLQHRGDQRKLADAIVQLLQPCPYTISTGALRLYLNSLVQMGKYDEYLVHVSHLIPEFQGYELADILATQANTVVIPRFNKQLSVMIQSVKQDPLNVEVSVYRDQLVKLAKLLTRGRDVIALSQYSMNAALASPTESASSDGAESNGKQLAAPLIPGNDTLTVRLVTQVMQQIYHGFMQLFDLMRRQQEEVEDLTRDTQPILAILTNLLYKPQWRRDQQWDKVAVPLVQRRQGNHSGDDGDSEAIQSSLFLYPPVDGEQTKFVVHMLERIRRYLYGPS
ncbi:hypothetical protein H4R34_003856 [Dimargaris verticillata]|uniref:Uncharacterized protein n=1 Tax=Dimargaris verticillata TaxID=2761393 RepID=A0A9W8B5B6_9FUNG|nr:hypothetical protein H4R34_003856 [Dimargaris verticillata]